MLQSSHGNVALSRRYALCVGIGTYPNLLNRNLRYAVADATVVAERLADPLRGGFAVRVLTDPMQTTKAALDEAVEDLLSAPDRQADDLILLYLSCHGDVNSADHTFCLLPSNVTRQAEGIFDPTTLLGIDDFARWFKNARALNIVVLLDVCHSGGAGAALQRFTLNLDAGPNFFFIGAARLDQVTMQSSMVHHGLFTHCLLRAFEQPPAEEGWLTISQIHTFVSHELTWFAKDQPTQIQSWSVSVNPNLPLLRNPGYPELCPLPPLWNVPYQRNPWFTGQEDLLSRLTNLLQNEQKTALTQPHALSGLGGIGKTQLALEYAYRHRQDYHAVLWGHADSREALISTFINVAMLLDLPEKDEQDQQVIIEAVKTWLKNRSTWLFILDNADDLALVKEFLPPAFRGHLLITTRAQAMGGFAHKLEMEVMRPAVGALFLLRRSGRLTRTALLENASPEDILEAEVLSQELGGLPLALDQAGAYMEETKCRLGEYREIYAMRRADLLKTRGSLMADHPEPVATTWSLSFQRVEGKNAAAAELLCFCAYLAPDAIPEEILTEGAEHLGPVLAPVAADAYLLSQAVVTLCAYSLIDRDPQTRTLTIHRLVQAVLRDAMDEERSTLWAGRTVQSLNAVFPGVGFSNWMLCERYILHAHVCAAFIEEKEIFSPEAASLLDRVAGYLFNRGRYAEAEPLVRRALAINELTSNATDPDIAGNLHNLAIICTERAKYEEAESLYRRALQILEQQSEPISLDVATVEQSLADLYRYQAKYEQAELLYQQALQLRGQQLGPAHSDVAGIMNSLANLYSEQGKYEEAEPLYQRALQIQEQLLGSMHPYIATDLHNLAVCYTHQGKYKEAEALYQCALQIQEQVLGSEHPDIAVTLGALATLYTLQRKHKEAKPLYERALQIEEQALGPMHPRLASTLHGLASVYYKQFKFEQAKLLYERALQIEEQALGPMHPDLARTLNNLAPIYVLQGLRLELDALQGELERVESLLQRAIQIKEQTLGPTHLDVAGSLSNLGTFYALVRHNRELAEPLIRRALDIYKQQLGSRHPRTRRLQRLYSFVHFLYHLKRIFTIPRRMLQRLRHWVYPNQSDG